MIQFKWHVVWIVTHFGFDKMADILQAIFSNVIIELKFACFSSNIIEIRS